MKIGVLLIAIFQFATLFAAEDKSTVNNNEYNEQERVFNEKFKGKKLSDLIAAWGNPDEITDRNNLGMRVKEGTEDYVAALVYFDRTVRVYITKNATILVILTDLNAQQKKKQSK